jgi:hypothetical protein
MDRRLPLLGLLALLATAWGAWQIYAGWGLVTLDVRNQPVSKVLASIARQGGIEIASNLDPSTPVSLKVKRVPPVEALDIVAVRTDASWRLAYLGAPDEKSIDAALAAFRSGSEAEGWSSYGGGGFTVIEPQSGAALDLRRVKWTPRASGNLHDLLEDAAQKTGVLLAASAEWNPSTAPPGAGTISETVVQLFGQAGGVSHEIFLLRARPRGEDDDTGRGRGGPWIGRSSDTNEGNGGGWRRAAGDQQATAERVEAQIALLPESERAKARENFKTMRDFWQSVRELPEEQRRAKAQEFFSRPEVIEDMETRRLARWAKMTPEQRIDRNRSYWERKNAARNQSR